MKQVENFHTYLRFIWYEFVKWNDKFLHIDNSFHIPYCYINSTNNDMSNVFQTFYPILRWDKLPFFYHEKQFSNADKRLY